MRMTMRTFTAISTLLLIFSLSASAQPRGQVIDQVVAVVGDEPILKSDLTVSRTQLRGQGMKDKDIDDCTLLEDLLFEKLLLNQAQVDSVEVTEEQVKNEMQKRLNVFIQQVGSREALEEYYDKSMNEIKEELYDVLQQQMLVQRMQQKITQNLNTTPQDVRDYYESLTKDSVPRVNAAVEVGHIVKYPEVSREERLRVKERLREFKEGVVSGERDFTTLAVLYSQDPGSASKGGELGMTTRGTMVPEFDAVAMKLAEGEISDVFETDFGYHIMKMIEKDGDQYNARHILLKPKVSNDQLEESRVYLDSIATLIERDSISFEEAARKYSDDESTSNQNGFIVNQQSGSTVFEMDELDPQLFLTIDTLEVGEVSAATLWSDRKGQQGYRLVKLISRSEAHLANLKDDYQMLQNQASQKLRQEKMDSWIREKVEETYIHINDQYKSCNYEYDWSRKESSLLNDLNE